MSELQQLENVTVKLKANVYFDGKVISHTLTGRDGARKTVGVIYPGNYKFNTDAPERMDILAGTCRVRIGGQKDWRSFTAGTMFQVEGRSSFEITVDSGMTEYLCTFE